jgi:hypothetical protein
MQTPAEKSSNSPVHMFLSLVGFLTAVTAVIMSIVVASRVLGEGCKEGECQSMLYVTTTFLSSRRIETDMGFPVATERDIANAIATPFNDPASASKDRVYRFGHFIDCMYTARMADKLCLPNTLNDYTACVSNASVIAGLDACASFPSVGGYYHWPTPEEYLGCVWNNPALQNSESRRASQNVFRACMDRTLWPFFEIPQGIDSQIVFGSFNWALLLLVGLVIMSSFAVYTGSMKEDGAIRHGESGAWMRLGMFSSLVALVWNLIFLVIFLVIAFRNSGEFQKGGGLPTTFSTSFVTVTLMATASLYFLCAFLQSGTRKFIVSMYHGTGSNVGVLEAVPMDTDTSDQENHGLLLRGTFPEVAPDKSRSERFEIDGDDVAKYYTPPLLAVWSDSYLADFCIVLGIAGATGQLSTDTAWNIVTLTLSYRVLNMIISRCISDAFTNNIRLDGQVNEAKIKIVTRPGEFYRNRTNYMDREGKNKDVHINTKVIGLSTQLACVILYIALITLVYNAQSPLQDFPIFQIFFAFCFVVPEAIRLVIHLYYQLIYTLDHMNDVPWLLYNSFYFVWLWDVVLRIIFISIVVVETQNRPGTFDFLKTQTNALMRDYLVQMAV